MKKIFAIAIAAILMASIGLVSCKSDKEEELSTKDIHTIDVVGSEWLGKIQGVKVTVTFEDKEHVKLVATMGMSATATGIYTQDGHTINLIFKDADAVLTNLNIVSLNEPLECVLDESLLHITVLKYNEIFDRQK
ncbi:MAG: hypothetical protein MJZ65_05020 [Paludibacteraceae bacterium]|nr:hypothetical protein [Paludibacteraceae bacterium]